MPGSEAGLLRSILTFGAICCVVAACRAESAPELVEEERRLARTMGDGAGLDGPAAGLPGESAVERFRGSGGPGAAGGADAVGPGSPAETPGGATDAAPTVSEDPARDSLAPGVRGRVTVRGVGLGGVPVRLETADGIALDATSRGGRTDQRGFFGFESVPPGGHTISLGLPDASGIAFPDTSRTVRVESAGALVRIDFDGRLLRDSGIRGVVRDRAGEPLEGVRVEVSGDALEGYATDLFPALASLPWADTTVTGPDGRYTFDTPAGWYQVSIWREEWLDSARFLRFQYRSPMPAVEPGRTVTEDFDLRDFETARCTVDRIGYGDRVEREPGSMRCGRPLHPEVTRFELWPFEGEEGDRIRISADISPGSPLLLLEPDGGVVSFGPDEPGEDGESVSTGPKAGAPPDEGPSGKDRRPGARDRVLTATLEQSGTHHIVVTYAGPAWSTADSYRLQLSGGAERSASPSFAAGSPESE